MIINLRTRYLESLLKVYSFSTISPEYCHKAERFTWCCCRSSPQWVTCQPTLKSWSLPTTQKSCKSMVSKHLKQNAGQSFERQYTSWRQLEDPKAEILFIYHSTHKKTKSSLFMTTDCPVLNLHDEQWLTGWLSVFWNSKTVLENASNCLDETDQQQKTKLLKYQGNNLIQSSYLEHCWSTV